MSCVFEANSAFDIGFTEFHPDRAWWKYLEEEYEKMRSELLRGMNLRLNLFASFRQTLKLARAAVIRLSEVFKIFHDDNFMVTPEYVCKHSNVLECLLRGATKNNLRAEKTLPALINEDSLRSAWGKNIDGREDYVAEFWEDGTTPTQSDSSSADGSASSEWELENDADFTGTSDSSSADGSASSEWEFENDADCTGTVCEKTHDSSTTTASHWENDSDASDRSTGTTLDLSSESFPWWGWTHPEAPGKRLGKGMVSPTGKRNAMTAQKGKGGIPTVVLATKKRKVDSQCGGPRRQLPRSKGDANQVHFAEDTIQDRPHTKVVNRPVFVGDLAVRTQLPCVVGDDEGLLFDEGATEFSPPLHLLPTIFIEGFRDKDGNLVTGPCKHKEGGVLKAYDIGSAHIHQREEKVLTEVMCCKTTSAYVYFFKNANLRPHFVVGNEEAARYRRQLEGVDVDLRVIPSWKLKDPVKVVSDLSLVHGLREGRKEESDFVFVSGQTKLFQQYFGGDLGQIPFPTSRWMEFFDQQALKSDQLDKLGRNFKFGHHDCGYGREGVSTSAHASQDEGIDFVLGKPHTIGDKEMMATLGPVLDRTTLMMDNVCYENEERLMNDPERDTTFGADMRTKTNSSHSRFEAYTIVRQPLGSADKVMGGDVDFPNTARHLDGPNCNRPGYTTTAVFSFLCVWKGTAYRTSVIMYTRQSCGNYCWRNYFARKLRQKLRDYIVAQNGGVHYSKFSLTDKMADVLGEYSAPSNKNNTFFLRPADGDLSPAFHLRNPASRWLGVENRESRNPEWKPFDWQGKFKTPLHTIVVPEFLCRYGFVSSFASQVNRFVTCEEIDTPCELTCQLLHIALLSSSQMQFYYVLELLMKNKRQIIANFATAKMETGGKTDVTLFRCYQKICETELTSLTGGPVNRIQAQPTVHAIFTDDDALRENLDRFPKLVDDIEKGRYLRADGVLKGRPGNELAVVGDVASLSCAPLLVFVGLAKSVHAVNTAKQSLVNTASRNSYFPRLRQFLDDHDTAAPKMKKDQDFFIRLFRGIAKSWNTVIGSVENGCCAVFRGKKKFDVYFRGQDLYNLDDRSSRVLIKKFGSQTWEVMEFPKGGVPARNHVNGI